jgi:glucose-6-phosphate 1-dehydrogenase
VVHCLESTRFEQLDATSASVLARLQTMLSGQTCLYFALPPAVTERACVALTEIDLRDLLLALEKPVGTDMTSARRVNRLLARPAPEEHIFRVDHFLGMPGVLNLIGLRSGNRLFGPVWNREHVERIEIVFDQVMAVLMMDPPSRLDDNELRTNARNVLRATHVWGDDSGSAVVLGRYTSGCVGDISLPSYVNEPGVRCERDTETFAQLVVEVDSWRWNGVPVILRSGRAIGDPPKRSGVVFKQQPHVYGPFCERMERNVLRVGLEQEEVTLEVDVGNPSRVTALQRVQLRAAAEQTHVSAYGNVVRWLLESNPAFMVRADGAEQGWRIRYTVLAEEGGSPLLDYPAGSTGPS